MRGTTTSIGMAVTLAIVIAAAPDRALGQPGPPPTMPTVPAATAPPQTRPQSYAMQLFVADALFTAMALGTQRAEPIIGLVVGGPLIHGLHGRGDAAVGSLLLRVTLPVLGLLVGAESCDERPVGDDGGCLDNAFIGFGVGTAVTLGIDYFALARKPVSSTPPRVKPAVTMTATPSSASVRFAF